MGRPALVTPSEILDAACRLLASGGVEALTFRAIRSALGISNGSLVHAFATRDALVTALWLRTVRRFEEGFVAVLTTGAPRRAIVGAAIWVIHWARTHPSEAGLLARNELRQRHGRRRARLASALDEVASRLDPADVARGRRLVRFAAIDVPHAAVRAALDWGRPLDALDEELVRRAARAALRSARTG
jgi:AcrR family transcriptional regulator